MAKFYGKIGFGVDVETGLDVYEPGIEERPYRGDVIRVRRSWDKGEDLNDNLNISNEISIVADAYAYEHFHAMRYVEWMGAKWKIRDITVERPRLILSIGGLWNGDTSGT